MRFTGRVNRARGIAKRWLLKGEYLNELEKQNPMADPEGRPIAQEKVSTTDPNTLRANNIDLSANTVRVEESSDQRNQGKIGLRKNATAYRTVLLLDPQGQTAMYKLRRIVEGVSDSRSLIFRLKGGGPLLVTNLLKQGFYAALDALGLEKADCTFLGEVAIGDGNLPQ
jgi:hypothetical protein